MITTDLLIWLAIVTASITVAFLLSPVDKDAHVRLRRNRVRDLTPTYHLKRTTARRFR